MGDEPNLNRQGLQQLEYVGRQGNRLVYQGPSKRLKYICMNSYYLLFILLHFCFLDKNMIMLDVETVSRLGMPIRPHKRGHASRISDEGIE